MWRDSESSEDFLNFTELADQIATLSTSASLLPISIGVFGGWGTGKSTVLKLVQAQLPQGTKGAPIFVQFDAWLYQGYDDSRAALMEVISDELIRLAEEKKSLVDKAKAFAARVNYFRAAGLIADFGVGMALGVPPGLLTSAGTAISALFNRGSVGADQYQEMRGDVTEARTSLAGLLRPGETRTPPQEIAAFRKEFGELLEGLDTTLVVFIDNLDRCLPDVAIGTLEAIRLFLFMPRTAFVIAADEDMIRHSVAKHFSDPNAAHVRDYLDKVIQVPMRVPQVGPEDLRAYMYSLFVSEAAPAKLAAVQARLMTALQNSWRGEAFEKGEISKLAGDPPELLNNLGVADQLAPMLATAPNVQGNPRIVKRLMNAVSLRRGLAAKRQMNVDLATLAKLAIFERCTDGPATLALYRLVMDGKDTEALLLPPADASRPSEGAPAEWAQHGPFIDQWRRMEPLFDDVKNLRPAVFLSRDVLAPAPSRSGLSDAAKEAAQALLGVNSVNSPVGLKIVERLSPVDQRTVMSELIQEMRAADWSAMVPGIHGALIVAKSSTDAHEELRAFIETLQTGRMHRGVLFLLRQAKLVE